MDTAILAMFIPIIALLIPIVVILSKHQQKMAEIIRSQPQMSDDTIHLRHEVAELKSLIHQQAIQIDNLVTSKSSIAPPTMDSGLSSRLESEQVSGS